MADCRDKLVTIRTADGEIDSLWEVAPDDKFGATVFMSDIGLRSDRAEGGSPCRSFAQIEISGKLRCADRDRVTIALEATWKLGEGPAPRDSAERLCSLPVGCELFAAPQIRQCQ
jgi:hypothetical protein